MTTGHRRSRQQQQTFFRPDWQHQLSHGGVLRNQRRGRSARPLSCKEPLHAVFKVNRNRLKLKSLRAPRTFALILKILKHYSALFGIKVEQISLQHDHLHLLLRTSRRNQFHAFFRVLSGQMAQRFQSEGFLSATNTLSPPVRGIVQQAGTRLWMYRPFSRVVRGYRAYKTVRNYIELNEKEATGQIRYQKRRLRGLSSGDWDILWN